MPKAKKESKVSKDQKFASIFIEDPKRPKKAKFLIDVLDDYIYTTGNDESSFHRKQANGQVHRAFHPSKIAKAVCARKLVFEYCDAECIEGSKSFDAQLLRNFDNGHDVHFRLQKYLGNLHAFTNGKVSLVGRWLCKKCGKGYGYYPMDTSPKEMRKYWVPKPTKCSCGETEHFKYMEVAFSIPELKVSGKADGVILWAGKEYLLEIKSINPFGFSKLQGPPDYYLPQANLYMKGLALKECLWWFEDKGDQAIKEIITQYTPAILEKSIKLLQVAVRAINANKLPPVLSAPEEVKAHCKRCEWSRICAVDPPFGYNLKVADYIADAQGCDAKIQD